MYLLPLLPRNEEQVFFYPESSIFKLDLFSFCVLYNTSSEAVAEIPMQQQRSMRIYVCVTISFLGSFFFPPSRQIQQTFRATAELNWVSEVRREMPMWLWYEIYHGNTCFFSRLFFPSLLFYIKYCPKSSSSQNSIPSTKSASSVFFRKLAFPRKIFSAVLTEVSVRHIKLLKISHIYYHSS